MLKIKSFDKPVGQDDEINAFIASVDILENGIKFTSGGPIFILYKEKETEEEKKAREAKENEKIAKLPELAEDFNKEYLLKAYSRTLSDLTEKQLEYKTCLYVQTLPIPKGQETQHENQRAINTQRALRAVDQKKAELAAVKAVIDEIDAGTFKLE